jgi:hypothetical protein
LARMEVADGECCARMEVADGECCLSGNAYEALLVHMVGGGAPLPQSS